jgi:predicted TIM-barrel fold metal-dependent hydrolase
MGTISQALAELRVPGFEVLDCHAHLGPWLNFRMPEHSADSIVRVMEHVGIARSYVSPMSWMVDEERGFRQLEDAVSRFPEHIVGVPVANPNRPDHAIALLEEWNTRFGVTIVKIHPDAHEYSLRWDGYRQIIEAIAGRWIVLTHTWLGSPWSSPADLAHLAEMFPETVFLAGHSGGPVNGVRESIAVAASHPNIYLDLTGSLVLDGVIEWMVDELGASRVLFGTDSAFLDPRPQLGRVAMARIGADEKRQILGDNLKRILNEKDLA